MAPFGFCHWYAQRGQGLSGQFFYSRIGMRLLRIGIGSNLESAESLVRLKGFGLDVYRNLIVSGGTL